MTAPTAPTPVAAPIATPGPTPTVAATSPPAQAAAPAVLDGPRVLGVQELVTASGAPRIVLSFDERLDPARASTAGDYRVYVARRHHPGPGRAIRVASASYDAATRTVTLATAGRVARGAGLVVEAKGGGPGGLADAAGNRLDGLGTGRPGSDFSATLAPAARPSTPRGPARIAHAARKPR